MDLTACTALLARIRGNIGKVIVGKAETIDRVLVCLACGGHVLIEDAPGLGKTSLVSALADSISATFQRVQFTPDTLPSDVTGFYLYRADSGEKVFQPGAVMCQLLLADEINRTSPKTQSALLQAMQEGRVTVEGVTHVLPQPFMVCATQNPVELTGTYPLPEAQLDRFLMRVRMGYPERNDEIRIMEMNKARAAGEAVKPVADAAEVMALRAALETVTCARPVLNYITDLARATRSSEDIALGVSPRGSIALMRAAMGRALLSGRGHVLPDDVQQMAEPVLAHRLVLRAQAFVQEKTAERLVRDILRAVPPPATKG